MGHDNEGKIKTFLRDARYSDIDLLYEWANDDLVRSNAFSSGKISYDNHKKWFEQVNNDPNVHLFIYMYEKKPIGQIRLTVNCEKQVAEIDYSICEQLRGRGHGKEILRLVQEKVTSDFACIKKLCSKVKPDNVASIRAFEKRGFKVKYEYLEWSVDTGNILDEDIAFLPNGGGALPDE